VETVADEFPAKAMIGAKLADRAFYRQKDAITANEL
jgi:hypothetical protein